MKFLLLLFLLSLTYLEADIQLIKRENPDSNTTLLVIGGIHGNEPGGYFAPAILATHYKIKSKNLWIVPNLNADSIVANRRGIHGDMNRKFAYMKKNDLDRKIVEGIKKIILSKNVSLILNLHDGHGFYRKENQGSIFNPSAWGQTCVIDQCELKTSRKFGSLDEIAQSVKDSINKKLIKKHHKFNVKNTKTKFHDEAMQLSLTFFAVTHNKPAFAIETSKYLSNLNQKVFYQLVAIEEYMKIMGIEFTRDFDLTEQGVGKIITNYGTLTINNNIKIDLSDIKKSLSYVPLKSAHNEFIFSHPLGEVKKVNGNYQLFIGNKHISTLKPQHFKIAKNCQKKLDFIVDEKEISLANNAQVNVIKSFKVVTTKKQRVNIIGFHAKGDESDRTISLKKLNKRYSVDKSHKVYRVEFYKKDKFCSMVMVHFK